MWSSHEGLLRDESDEFRIPAGCEEDREALDEDESLPHAKYKSSGHCVHLPKFHFSAQRTRLDWGSLYGIDPQEVVRAFHLCFVE